MFKKEIKHVPKFDRQINIVIMIIFLKLYNIIGIKK